MFTLRAAHCTTVSLRRPSALRVAAIAARAACSAATAAPAAISAVGSIVATHRSDASESPSSHTQTRSACAFPGTNQTRGEGIYPQ
eukprot:772717-Prorocentrum_minimum.AAC.1